MTLLSLSGVLPAHADTIAVLQGLDKTTARIRTVEAPLNKQVRFQNLLITARACSNHSPEEIPESAAFLEIAELPPDAKPNTKPETIFKGWMFASTPAISALEDPVYDVSVLNCKEGPNTAVAPSPPPVTNTAAATPLPPAPAPVRANDSGALRVNPAPRP